MRHQEGSDPFTVAMVPALSAVTRQWGGGAAVTQLWEYMMSHMAYVAQELRTKEWNAVCC